MNGFDVACRLHSRSAALLALRLPLLGLLYAFPELGGLLEIGSLVLLTSVVAQSWRNQPGFPKTAIPAEIAVLGLQVCLMIGGIGSGRSDDPAWVPLQAVVFAVALVGLRFETRSRRALSYSAVLLLVFLQVAHTPLARFGCYPGEHLADNGNPLKYCGSLGHPSENATGLIYMRARYYDPLLGRFISEDPARDGGNWYAYAGNDPVGMVDLTGRSPTSALTNIGGATALLLGGVWFASAVLGKEVAPSAAALAYAAGFADSAIFAGIQTARLVALAAAYEHPWSVATGVNIGLGMAVGTSVTGVLAAAAIEQVGLAIMMDEWGL